MFNWARRNELNRQRVEQKRLEQAAGDEVSYLFNALAALFRELPDVTGPREVTGIGPKGGSAKTTAMAAMSCLLSQVVTSDSILVDVHRAAQTDRITEMIGLPADWLVRTMAPAVLAAAGLTDDAANLDQLPALTELEYDVLRADTGAEAMEMADAARISVLPHLVGQHAYRAVTAGVQLLHFRHGLASTVLAALRNQSVTGHRELQEQLADLCAHQEHDLAAAYGRTCRPMPVWTPQPRLGA